jgi:hypothetical protein
MADFKGQEFEFPDEKEAKGKPVDTEDEGFSVEVADDTPPEDQGRKASPPPADPEEDELEKYDQKAQQRIRMFAKSYHDERREKEAAQRERQAAEELAQQVWAENQALQKRLAAESKTSIEQHQSSAQMELDMAEKLYREAYEAGDTDRIVDAQKRIAAATVKIDRASSLKPLQIEEKELQIRREPPKAAPRVDEKAERWKENNEWFGSNKRMTSFALGLHQELVEDEGLDPTSDAYYSRIDREMRKTFPSQFAGETVAEEEPPRKVTKPASPVAPAARSSASKKVVLTASQAAVSKRLGVPLEIYAKKMAELRNGE